MNNSFDKISWELVEITKNTIKENITLAVTTDRLALNRDILPKLFSLIDSSVTEAYSKSHKSVSKKLEAASEESKKLTEQPLKKRK